MTSCSASLRLAAVTVDEPYVNGAFRAASAGRFPFSDVDRKVAEELDLLELTDETHRPFLPFTFVLDSRLVIARVWCGFWYWGNPTPDELRLSVRDRRDRAAELRAADDLGSGRLGAWTPASTRRSSGSGKLGGSRALAGSARGPAAGGRGRARQVDGRRPPAGRAPHRGGEGRSAIHLSKEGSTGDPRLVRHHITAGPRVP